jgi:CRP-like cAMP-binding protein
MKHLVDIPCQQCNEGFTNFFNSLDKADLHYLNEQKKTLFYKKGAVVFEEGRKPKGIFCLREGKIKVYKNSIDGREQITRILFPGELLGLKALLSGKPYSVSSAALEDSVLCSIDKTYFFQLMLKYPEFTRSIIVSLSKLLEQAEFRMLSLAHKPVRERLAETLLFLNKSFHSTAPSYPRTYLNITRQDIANIIGTAPETVIRLLSEFKDEKLIQVKGRKIFLTNIPRIRKIASI